MYLPNDSDIVITDEYSIRVCPIYLRVKLKKYLNLIANQLLEYDNNTNRVIILEKEDLIEHLQVIPE
jgi:hypothetical protein